MKKRIRDALISGALYLIILFSPMANGTGQADFGGKYDDSDLSIITSVDYSWSAGKFERDIEYIENQNLQIKYIIETHIHADHITSAYLFKRKYNAQICYGSKNIVYGADKLFDNNDKI